MIRKHRSRLGTHTVAVLAAASMALLALPAAAEHRDSPRERRAAEQRHDHGGHYSGGFGFYRPYRAYRTPRYARGVHERRAAQHDSRYYCELCEHRFRSAARFRRHLRHQHHVPPWRIPFVVVHHAFGWIFRG